MAKTPVHIKSIYPASRTSLLVNYDNLLDADFLSFAVKNEDPVVPITGVDVRVSELVERLNLIPGMTVKYEKPITIPGYLGAVIRRDDGMGGREQWVRYLHDGDSSLPWVDKNGNRRSNDDIAGILANGGYEVQPEFPRNGES